jgi:hypothetical protein
MAVVNAFRSPHSFSSSPLPESPKEDTKRMFMRGGSGRSTGSSSRSPSLREIDEEAALVDDGGGKLYVALGKDLKDNKSNLSAVRRLGLLGDLKLVLLHVHQPAERIMSGKASTLFPATAVFVFGSLVDRLVCKYRTSESIFSIEKIIWLG